MSTKKNNSQRIPSTIIATGKVLEKLSLKLAGDFATKLFITPILYPTPKREEEMENNSEKIFIDLPIYKHSVRVFNYGDSNKKVLLVHGWSGRGTQLVSIANALIKEGYSVVSFDAPAHGKSTGKVAYMTMFMESIIEVDKKFGPFEAAVGHSLGGMSVLNSLTRGFSTKKAVTIGSGDLIDDIIADFVTQLELKSEIGDRIKYKIEKKLGGKMTDYDVYKSAQNIDIPVLVIHDNDDDDVNVKAAHNLHKYLKNSELLITDTLGHRKILGDKNVVNKIIDFIKE